MKVKEYKIFKTAAKTAKENNLVFKDKENIFDFSLLDSMTISDREKEHIKEHDIRYVSAALKNLFTALNLIIFRLVSENLYIMCKRYFQQQQEKLNIGSSHLRKLNTIRKKEFMFGINTQ